MEYKVRNISDITYMPKEKISIRYRILHWFTYHPWLKLIALILAIIVWFYIRDEITRFN